jgi:hypothetical protein
VRAKGWDQARLWSLKFWDQARGLTAVLEPDDEIAEVTANYIAILKTQNPSIWQTTRGNTRAKASRSRGNGGTRCL